MVAQQYVHYCQCNLTYSCKDKRDTQWALQNIIMLLIWRYSMISMTWSTLICSHHNLCIFLLQRNFSVFYEAIRPLLEQLGIYSCRFFVLIIMILYCFIASNNPSSKNLITLVKVCLKKAAPFKDESKCERYVSSLFINLIKTNCRPLFILFCKLTRVNLEWCIPKLFHAF